MEVTQYITRLFHSCKRRFEEAVRRFADKLNSIVDKQLETMLRD